ncbi:hypothetical protein ACJ41O_001171 [Fusarium nematophilum]
MEDAVRISTEKFRSIYQDSYRTWARLHRHVAETPPLRARALFARACFQQQPFFPRNLSLKYDKRGAYTTGSSVWGSTGAACVDGLPPFRQPVQIKVAAREPVSLSISEATQGEAPYAPWIEGDDYLAVLMLAWAYILSARWAEVMPGSCSLAYTDDRATYYDRRNLQQGPSSIGIDIGGADPEETRWWAAVLAPSQGWQASMAAEESALQSPWSIRLQSSLRFYLVQIRDDLPPPRSAASFSDAIGYLDKFCIRHNLVDQSHAALVAVLLLPSLGGRHNLQLPAPKVGSSGDTPDTADDSPSGALQHGWMLKNNQIDKLLTLSCNVRGIRPMLLSAFFEPDIECNAVTPWLQGTLAAIEHLTGNDPYTVSRMCMERAPRAAYLWLGSLILGLSGALLQEVRFGQIPIDLQSALWSGTVQSFIQLPLSRPLVVDGRVMRADECRLLFLSQSGHHARTPVCPWKPFGSIPVEDMDIEIRVHAGCEDHQLQYQGIFWDCEDGKSYFQLPGETDDQNTPDGVLGKEPSDPEPAPVSFGACDPEKDVISENATRSIFGWLRFEGYSRHEQEIWSHEWFDMSDSEEEVVEEDDASSGKAPQPPVDVSFWLSDVDVSTNDKA